MQTPAGLRDIELTALRNGIHVVSETMPGVRSAAVGVWVVAGSRTENSKESGISHFIEHMLFKGTWTRSAEAIAREADSIGGHLDAFTGKELAGYTTKVLGEHLSRGFDILADLVLHPRFDESDIEKEKGVILEELKMDHDNPETQVHDLFMAAFYPRHALGRPILGYRGTIHSFQAQGLRDRHARYYQPANITITAAGDVRHEELVRMVEDRFGGLLPGVRTDFGSPPAPHAKVLLKNRSSLHQVQVCIGMPACGAADPRRYSAYLLNLVLGGGMSSRLFQDIRERQGLAYSIYSELNLHVDSGCLAVYAGTSAESLRPLLASVAGGLRDIKETLVPDDELRRAKDHLKGATVLSLESTNSRMGNLARQFLTFGRFHTIDEITEGIEAVTAEQVREVAVDFCEGGKIGVTALGRLEGFQEEAARLEC